MDTQLNIIDNEGGFVLVISLLMLLILVIIGVGALNTSSIDLRISGNERVHKQTFYQADAGAALASRLIEENISCPEGFTPGAIDFDGDGNLDASLPNIVVNVLDFALPDPTGLLPSDTPATELPSPTNRDSYVPNNAVILPDTNLIMGGITQFNAGSNISMNTGYSGLGYSAAAGGASILYEINSQNLGLVNSESIVSTRWRHQVGMEGECNY